MSTALITGFAGFVGQRLASRLLDEGWNVHGVDLVNGDDVRDFEQVRKVMDTLEPDVVFHLAAVTRPAEGLHNPGRALEVNTLGTLNILQAAVQTGFTGLIHLAGTSEEYGYRPAVFDESSLTLPTSAYGVSKLAAGLLGEVFSKEHGLRVLRTRAFNHTGPGQSARYAVPAFCKRVAQAEVTGDPVKVGWLGSSRNFSHVDDVVDAYIRLATGGHTGLFTVGQPGESHHMTDIMSLLFNMSSRTLELFADRTASWDPSFRVDTTHLEAQTGWSPKHTLADTLQETLDYWRFQR